MSREAKEGIILAQAVISVVSDFAFAAFPILFLWRVQIDLKTKIGLWILMGLGFITGACCLVRTVLNNQSVPLDGTYDGIINWLWRLFEVQIGIIAACIPTLRPLYLWIMRRVGGEPQGLDTNIKFPLTNKAQSWVENAGGGHGNGSDTAMDKLDLTHGHDHDRVDMHGHGPGHGHQHKDTMTDDLIREGILAPEPKDSSKRIDSAHPEEITEDPRLENEMHKYGIDDSLV